MAFFKEHPAVRHVVEGEEALGSETVAELARFIEDRPPISPDALARWLEPFQAEAVAAGYGRLLLGKMLRSP